MRTQACPAKAATNGSIASAIATSATPAQTLSGTCFFFLVALIGGPPRLRRSCALADPLAQQAGRTEDQHQDQHEEGEHVLVIAAEHAHLAVLRRALLQQRVGKQREAADVRYVADIAGAERLD